MREISWTHENGVEETLAVQQPKTSPSNPHLDDCVASTFPSKVTHTPTPPSAYGNMSPRRLLEPHTYSQSCVCEGQEVHY